MNLGEDDGDIYMQDAEGEKQEGKQDEAGDKKEEVDKDRMDLAGN
jgi:hypothetical protein